MYGVSKQAYYKRRSTAEYNERKQAMTIDLVTSIRARHPRMGTRKLHKLMSPILAREGFFLGKDALFDMLASHGMLVRNRRRRSPITTISNKWRRQYEDLVTGKTHDILPLTLVADITYVMVNKSWVYLALVTELRTRYILGHHVSQRMSVEALCLPALKQALANVPQKLWLGAIHHSDRGSQYLSEEYTGLLKECLIQPSTTQNGSPYENAVAERVNGIIKNEYLPENIKKIDEAVKHIKASIELYNNERPHESLGFRTPGNVWKNYLTDVLS